MTGAWNSGQTFDDDDWRRNGKNFGLTTWAPENLPKNLAIVDRLREIARSHGKTLPQLAIGWVLAHPAVTVALCGARKPKEILEDVGGDWVMPQAVRDDINRMVLAEGVGVGKVGDPGP